MVCYVRTIFEILRKIIFKVVQMKCLAMHITNHDLRFDIFTVRNLMEHDLKYPNDFWHKIKIYVFDPDSVLLAIAVNIAVLLMTASVLQGHT